MSMWQKDENGHEYRVNANGTWTYNPRTTSVDYIHQRAQKIRQQQKSLATTISGTTNGTVKNTSSNIGTTAKQATQKATQVSQTLQGVTSNVGKVREEVTDAVADANKKIDGVKDKVEKTTNQLNKLKNKAAGLKGLSGLSGLFGAVAGNLLISKMMGKMGKMPAGKLIGQIANIATLAKAISEVIKLQNKATTPNNTKAVDKDGNEIEESSGEGSTDSSDESSTGDKISSIKNKGYLPTKEMIGIMGNPEKTKQMEQADIYTKCAENCTKAGQIHQANIYKKMALSSSMLATTGKYLFNKDTVSNAEQRITEYKKYKEDKEQAWKEFQKGYGK